MFSWSSSSAHSQHHQLVFTPVVHVLKVYLGGMGLIWSSTDSHEVRLQHSLRVMLSVCSQLCCPAGMLLCPFCSHIVMEAQERSNIHSLCISRIRGLLSPIQANPKRYLKIRLFTLPPSHVWLMYLRLLPKYVNANRKSPISRLLCPLTPISRHPFREAILASLSKPLPSLKF